MQLFALDQQIPLLATQAFKQKDYTCPECQQTVRLRSGPHRQAHFFHVQSVPTCRQHQKSAEHLQAQLKILSLLPSGEGSLERPFPAISRIADVVWETAQIVFEIQCSPISSAEVEERTAAYRAIGMGVVWILHTKRFNKRRLSSAEHLLRQQPCYYTNITEKGMGLFYDQFEVVQGAIRFYKGPALPISLQFPKPISVFCKTSSVSLIARRASLWDLSFRGDLLDRFNQKQAAYQQGMEMLEKKFCRPSSFSLAIALKRLYALFVDWLIRSCAKN
jgi:competence protein CoiA